MKTQTKLFPQELEDLLTQAKMLSDEDSKIQQKLWPLQDVIRKKRLEYIKSENLLGKIPSWSISQGPKARV